MLCPYRSGVGGDLATAKDILVANNTVMLELNLIP